MRQGPPTVGDVLTQKLAELDIRPTDLARRAGVKVSMIGRLLSGYVPDNEDFLVSKDVDALLAEHLGTLPEYWTKVAHTRCEWERMQVQRPNEEVGRLRKVLVSAVGYDDDRIDQVVQQIMAAIDEYRMFTAGVVDEATGAKVTTAVADMRRTLKNFANALDRNKGVLEPRQRNSVARWFSDLTIHARMLLAKHLDAPLGAALRDLDLTRKATKAALAEATKAPDKEADYWRMLLAADVALALRDVLAVKLTTVRHTHCLASESRAEFSRVLGTVLAIIEGWSEWAAQYRQGDLNRLLLGAMRIIEDPESPIGKRRKRRKWRPRPRGRVTIPRRHKWGRYGGKRI